MTRGRRRRVLAALLVGATAAAARSEQPPALDRVVGAALSRSRGRVLDHVAGAVTDAGSMYGLVGTTAALAAAGRPGVAARVGIAGGTAWGAAQGAKELHRRERPYELGTAERLVHPPAGSSWPSGHAAVAAAVATAAAPALSRPASAVLGAVAGVVATTRVQLGVHHPTDVVAGAALGTLVAELTGWLGRRAVAAVRGGG